MSTINIRERSLVLVLGPLDERARQIAATLSAYILAWDIYKPAISEDALRAALNLHERVVLTMAKGSRKARETAFRIARRRGLGFQAIQVEEISLEADESTKPVRDHEGLRLNIVPMASNLKHEAGPFDLIGDVHGCANELKELLVKLGHADWGDDAFALKSHPDGRKVILLGDLTDRGPENHEVLRIAIELKEAHGAICVLGNHDEKLARWLAGNEIEISLGMSKTVEELERASAFERRRLLAFLRQLEPHYVLDSGRLVAAHAGLAEHLHGEHTGEARSFALYGLVGEGQDPAGYPNRFDWASEYEGKAYVVQGHDVYDGPRERGLVHAIDTGCVFGGHLTAMRWPEREYVQVKAHQAYATGFLAPAHPVDDIEVMRGGER